MRGHEFERITVQSVSVREVNHPSFAQPEIHTWPKAEAEERTGCSICGMSLGEALEVDCPGMRMETIEDFLAAVPGGDE